MKFTLQKANLWKRISAFSFDLILAVSLALALMIGFSAVFCKKHFDRIEEYRANYEMQYGIDFDITQEEYDAKTEEEKATYDAILQEANEAYKSDKAVQKVYSELIYLTFANIAICLFVSDMVIYFVIPLLFKNGQTLGKKCFGIAVMRTNGVKLSAPVLFVRSILGLYTIETMVPILFLTMILVGLLGIVGFITLGLLAILEIGVMIYTKTNSSIHDLLSDSVVVDMSTQKIFASNDELITYQKTQEFEHAESEAEISEQITRPMDETNNKNN